MKTRFTTSNRQEGFTLIELLVAMLLTIFLAGGAILVHMSGRQASVDAERLARMQENIRFASDYLVRDLRNAGFRDETTLRIGHETQIREDYAQFVDDDSDGIADVLIIRYAGRGHCTEAFNTFRLVENRYYLANGQLTCQGRSVLESAPGNTLITAQDWTDGVGLVSGIANLAFQPICPDGGTACACDLVNNPDTSCIGTRIAVQMIGPQSIAGSGRDDRTIELIAAFRNVILERIRNAGSGT
ncbi:MAG: prepilin-type N-terminal cleavage/methylation domain-containing protein [Xanthomonadales bacterium]|jgi:prepilin-type N-terminal cleavage/methylation domain-containing protein|nr:prepilin-type N-terminal cleavage/methylation domain-containing protein [Xanthomonadales bacterium]